MRRFLALGLGGSILSALVFLRAEQVRVKDEVAAIRERQEAASLIIEDMARKPAALAATSTLEGQEPHPVVSLEGALVIGSAGARVGILEFGDYECPYCARLAEESLPRLKAEYVSKGLVKYAFMNFPLESIHPYAREAAEAALCADEQGKFWNMHERLFTARGRLDKVAVAVMAEEMTLDPSRFRECVSSTRPSERVRMVIG